MSKPALRVAIPTKDRPGNVSLAIASVAQLLRPVDTLVLYDDGHRPATADYATRFALDIALQLGARVEVIRGKPQGIHMARVHMLRDAAEDIVHTRFLMVDDDILMNRHALKSMHKVLDNDDTLDYSVPIIGLSNNEANVERFGDVSEATSTHNQQFVLNGSGVHRIEGGAWTCAIMFDMQRFNPYSAISRLENGPSVVEDYVLTRPLNGAVDRSALVWHVMSPEQGLRDWNGRALAYLRKQLGSE